ncbi:MAG: hypothetical protein JRD04_02210 [Deltaproteobacteria bacterium]|nr:hypothetical protein [Deltaproteobacteria bacterium]
MADEKQPEVEQSIDVTLAPSDDIIPHRVYSNYVQVTQTPHDYSLRFCDATPIYDVEKVAENDGVFPIPVVAEIVIPLEVMPSLIKTLQAQYEKRLKISKGEQRNENAVQE